MLALTFIRKIHIRKVIFQIEYCEYDITLQAKPVLRGHVGLWRGHDTFVVSLKLMWRSFNWHLYKNQGEYQNSITTTISALVFSHNICTFKCKLSLEGNNFQLYPCLLSNLIADTNIKNMRKNLCNSQLVQNSTLKKLSIKYPKVLLHEERPCLRPYTPALFLK